MQAIEFIAELKNDTIKIPKEYMENLGKKVRIIILVDEAISGKKVSVKNKTIKKKFTAFKVDTKKLKINREEANVRKNLL